VNSEQERRIAEREKQILREEAERERRIAARERQILDEQRKGGKKR
jgi:hypothetical protein